MAGNTSSMAEAIGGMGRLTELRHRLFFVLGALLVYRIGTFIPVPGVNPDALAALFQQGGTMLDMFNMFSGGALERASLFALGVMPYISASIIVQLMTSVIPQLEQLKKEGESGRRKITQYTRYGTVGLATFQSVGIAVALQGQSVGGASIVVQSGYGFVFTAAVSLVTGTMFLMWLGEQITERGIGNGISLIIFSGIVAGLPAAIGGTLRLVETGEMNALAVLVLFALALAVTAFVVFVERGQRRITVNYARRQQGRKMMAAQSTHLPLKINMAGVIPPIFASSILLFPGTIGQWLGQSEGMRWVAGHHQQAVPRGAGVCTGLLAGDHLFLLLLHGPGVQCQGDGRQSQAFGCLHPRDSPRGADGPLRRYRHDPAHRGGGPVHHRGLPAAGVPDRRLERPLLLRRDLVADHRGGRHGFHGPGPGTPHVAPV